MPQQVYLFLHLTGLILTFFALGGATLHALNGGDRESNRGRVLIAAFHGLGTLLLLVAGFGLLAKLHLGFPIWVWPKLAIWLVLGGAPALIKRKPELAKPIWFVLPLLGMAAALLGIFKPVVGG